MGMGILVDVHGPNGPNLNLSNLLISTYRYSMWLANWNSVEFLGIQMKKKSIDTQNGIQF